MPCLRSRRRLAAGRAIAAEVDEAIVLESGEVEGADLGGDAFLLMPGTEMTVDEGGVVGEVVVIVDYYKVRKACQ